MLLSARRLALFLSALSANKISASKNIKAKEEEVIKKLLLIKLFITFKFMIEVKNGLFHIFTEKTSYVIGVREKTLFHLYWGKRLHGDLDFNDFLITDKVHLWACRDMKIGSEEASTEALPMEYPVFGSPDLRNPALSLRYDDGSSITKLSYVKYEKISGKPQLEGLPATYAESADEAETLIITLRDEVKNVVVELYYSVFYGYDAITRSARIINCGDSTVSLEGAMSASLDFQYGGFDLLHLPGTWAYERVPERTAVIKGKQTVESLRGVSSAYHNPFIALLDKHTTENSGNAFGLNLVYSGNFVAGTECDTFLNTRAFIGINPYQFEFLLSSGDSFQTPEAVMVFSERGIGGMSRIYHKLYRERLCRGKYRDINRMVLVNNWEGTYFDFDEKKLTDIAAVAARVGIDLFVLDDGWFGERDKEDCSLGDWFVNKKKLPNGLKGLSEKINGLGMKFGLWIEPEMVSPNSELYRTHPDWCLQVKGRDYTMRRNQLILDLTREDVRRYIIESICSVIDSADIEYIKWDMNRNFSEVGSLCVEPERQREIYHRYVLGLYEILETVTCRYPDILFESCQGGGGRFDPGMLYYTPQIWTSDNTDAYERLFIQYGTGICYPYSAMGCHVSAVPNHQTGRTTPYNTRFLTALPGQLGYELDLCKLSEAEIEDTAEQIKLYKKIGNDIHTADLYRIAVPGENEYAANEFISRDGKTVYLFTYVLHGRPENDIKAVRLLDLDENAVYADKESGKKYSGSILLNVGLPLKCDSDYSSRLIILEKLTAEEM